MTLGLSREGSCRGAWRDAGANFSEAATPSSLTGAKEKVRFPAYMAHDISHKSLGEVIREARDKKDLSLRDLAKKLDKALRISATLRTIVGSQRKICFRTSPVF